MINHKIERLKPYTEHSVFDIQNGKVPVIYDLKLEFRTSYYLNGIENTLWQTNRLIYLVSNLPITINYKRVIDEIPLQKIIEDGDMLPFLLFADGRFIKWSDISIVWDSKYSYIIIDNIETKFPKIDCIVCPEIEYYTEEATPSQSKSTFVFDNDGLSVIAVTDKCTAINIKNIYAESFGALPNTRLTTNIDTKYSLSDKNIILFKNGLLETDIEVLRHPYNIIEIVDKSATDTDYYIYRAFIYTGSNTIKSNANTIRNKESLMDRIVARDNSKFISDLSTTFDFDLSRLVEYKENTDKAFEYIRNYNSTLLDEVYDKLFDIYTYTYTGAELINRIDDSGMIRMSRRANSDISCYVIIYKNGLLFDDYGSLIYENKDFLFNVSNIKADDIIDIHYYSRIDNRYYPITLDSNGDNVVVLDPTINIKNMRLFTTNPIEMAFDIPRSFNTQYSIPYTAERVLEDVAKINIDARLIDKKLYLASIRQFRSYTYTATEDTIKVELPEDFVFCTDPRHYMVFVDGIKLNVNKFKVTCALESRPFDKQVLYTTLPVYKGHTINIFYVPNELTEFNYEIDTEDRIIVLDREKLPYSLSPKRAIFYINGRRLSKNEIIEISNSLIALNFDSIGHLKLDIVTVIPPIDRIKEYNKSLLDDMVESLDNETLTELFVTNNDTKDLGEDAFKDELTVKSILYEVIKDFWLRPNIYKGDPFVFDYDVEYFQDVFNKDYNLYNIELANGDKNDKVQYIDDGGGVYYG